MSKRNTCSRATALATCSNGVLRDVVRDLSRDLPRDLSRDDAVVKAANTKAE